MLITTKFGKRFSGVWAVIVLLVLFELAQEYSNILRVPLAQTAVILSHVAIKALGAGGCLHGRASAGAGGILSVAAVGQPFALSDVPQMTGRWNVGPRSCGVTAARVGWWPIALIEVSR